MINLYKKIGETPLECLDRFREHNPEYKDASLSYAGRLDPMAEGVLLVLAGEENKKREKYLSLDKEYSFEVLFGFETDTYDILGRVSKSSEVSKLRKISKENIKEILETFKGKMIQKYPAYSSKTVLGKPLFEWARSEKLNEIEIPSREVEIHSMVLENHRMIGKEELRNFIKERIALVRGDFRQKEIIALWSNVLNTSKVRKFPVARIYLKCSSGTYARSLAHSLGERLEIGALALSIVRTKVGNWSLEGNIR